MPVWPWLLWWANRKLPEPGPGGPPVDIVVPAYNEEENIVRLLRSIDADADCVMGEDTLAHSVPWPTCSGPPGQRPRGQGSHRPVPAGTGLGTSRSQEESMSSPKNGPFWLTGCDSSVILAQ